MVENAAAPKRKKGPLGAILAFNRRVYDWVLHWAETPYGGIALFLLALAESSFFPIPPDVLLIALSISVRKKAFRYAAICSVASILGGAIGYGIGSFLWYSEGTPEAFSSVATFFFDYVPGFTVERFEQVKTLYQEYDFWIVFAAAFTPIPYKVITVTAGVFELNLLGFMVASTVGRSARFFLVAGLIYLFGPPIKGWIDRYFNLLSLAFLVLLVGGFVVLKLIMG